ncbi:MAG: GNAT family N-acetyltransferase [Caldilineaceae bacterium]
MLQIRRLAVDELERLAEIDVAEKVTLSYRWQNRRLEAIQRDSERPSWNAGDWAHHVAEWQQHLQPDLWLGAFDGERLVGAASLRYQLRDKMAQLTTLHIDRNSRRQGVAHQLTAEVKRLAKESGAEFMYVSATESQSAVGFYLSQGFVPTNEPDPRLFALEPEDIHMICPLLN